MIFAAYILAAILIGLSALAERGVRHCAVAILIGLLITKGVTMFGAGIGQYALWGVTWAVCAYVTSRQMLCSVFLFASGLCYLFAYLNGLPVGSGLTSSVLIDLFGVLALLSLGGQIVANYLGYDRASRFLGASYPSLLGRN